MQQLGIGVVLVLFTIAAEARCLTRPSVLYEMEVHDCRGVAFFASPTKVAIGEESNGDRRDGVIVSGTILSSKKVWDERPPHEKSDTAKIDAGEYASFFIRGDAALLCSRKLPEKRHVLIPNWCCDLVGHRDCLVPLQKGSFEENPARWYEHQPKGK